MKYSWLVRKKNGKHWFQDRKQYDSDFAKIEENEIGRYTYETIRNKRSLEQNNFYRGFILPSVCECLKEKWGITLTSQQAHDNYMKRHIWGESVWVDAIDDYFIVDLETMTGWDTKQWEERMDYARDVFLTKFDWQLPIPIHEY